jgi:ABC-type multidrug transport system fused ATPase/permease subunit
VGLTIMDDTMKSKLFISYSHYDERFINQFIKHLSPLKQNGLISEWYDRKIISGEYFQEKIDENLEDADIICLFISANFISSNACIKEKNDAFSLKRHRGSIVVPIILTECAWQDIDDISQVLALPQDGKAISSFSDVDVVWKNVYDGLKKVIEKRNIEMSVTNTSSFVDFLKDTEILKSAHSKKTVVQLNDIFVFPNMQKINYDDEEEDVITTEQALLDEFFKFKKLLIAGESQSGKTTFVKLCIQSFATDIFSPFIYLTNHISLMV